MFSTVTADEFWFLTRWDMHTQMLLVHAQVTAPNKWFSTQTDGLAPKTDGSTPRLMVFHLNICFCTRKTEFLNFNLFVQLY